MNYFLAKVLNKIGLLRNFTLKVHRKIDNSTFHIPVINGIGFENLHISEMWMCDVFRRLNVVHGTFIDVGVNVGQTLLKWRAVNSTGDYIGFEPNPQCVFYTENLIKANNFQNCRIIPAGVFTSSKLLSLNFYSDSDTDSSASLIENFREVQKVYHKKYIATFKFSEVNESLNLTNVSIIKIDVEGAELEVLLELKGVMISDRPFVLIEILPCYSAENSQRVERQKRIEQLVDECGYNKLRIVKRSKNKIDFQHVHEIGIHSNIEWCDYVFVPKEKVNQLSLVENK